MNKIELTREEWEKVEGGYVEMVKYLQDSPLDMQDTLGDDAFLTFQIAEEQRSIIDQRFEGKPASEEKSTDKFELTYQQWDLIEASYVEMLQNLADGPLDLSEVLGSDGFAIFKRGEEMRKQIRQSLYPVSKVQATDNVQAAERFPIASQELRNLAAQEPAKADLFLQAWGVKCLYGFISLFGLPGDWLISELLDGLSDGSGIVSEFEYELFEQNGESEDDEE